MIVGGPLTTADRDRHVALGIEADVLEAAQVRRVTDRQAREECGLRFPGSSDLSGVVYPRIDPWTTYPVGYRVRRDHPEVRNGKPDNKYISSMDRAHAYVVPGTSPETLADVSIPVIFVEAEKSALSIASAADRCDRDIIAIAVGGCWSWRCKRGVTPAADGTMVAEKGVLPEFDRIAWKGRAVFIGIDANATTNVSTKVAARRLQAELTERGAAVRLVQVPSGAGINGPDDYIGARGDGEWWALVDRAAASSKAAAVSGSTSSQATQLVDLALQNGVELWHTPSDDPYATITVDGHREHHTVHRMVQDYLTRLFYDQTGRAPTATAKGDAVATLSAKAKYSGATHAVALRVGHHEQTIYIDLGDSQWRCVEIDEHGWRVVTDTPIRFWRPKSLRPLPAPISGGTIEFWREWWQVDDDTSTLIFSWLIAALSRGPYPILILTGEAGSGKSTLGRMLRDVLDPALPPLRGVPKDERDVMIGARTSHVVALDNLSGVSGSLSDALCRVATGGGLATRTLYTDVDETLIDVVRPILLNGIDQPATRGDLLDRSLVIHLPVIDDRARASECHVWERFRSLVPGVLGALCDAASVALRRFKDVRLVRQPRMADACQWATAAAPALGWPDTRIADAWLGARAISSADLLANDAIAQALLATREDIVPWQGSAGELLALLNQRGLQPAHSRGEWPATARKLSSRLRRLAPDLRRAGLNISLPNGARTARDRIITITDRGGGPDEQDQQDIPHEIADLSQSAACPDAGQDGAIGRTQDNKNDRETGHLSGPSGSSCSSASEFPEMTSGQFV